MTSLYVNTVVSKSFSEEPNILNSIQQRETVIINTELDSSTGTIKSYNTDLLSTNYDFINLSNSILILPVQFDSNPAFDPKTEDPTTTTWFSPLNIIEAIGFRQAPDVQLSRTIEAGKSIEKEFNLLLRKRTTANKWNKRKLMYHGLINGRLNDPLNFCDALHDDRTVAQFCFGAFYPTGLFYQHGHKKVTNSGVTKEFPNFPIKKNGRLYFAFYLDMLLDEVTTWKLINTNFSIQFNLKTTMENVMIADNRQPKPTFPEGSFIIADCVRLNEKKRLKIMEKIIPPYYKIKKDQAEEDVKFDQNKHGYHTYLNFALASKFEIPISGTKKIPSFEQKILKKDLPLPYFAINIFQTLADFYPTIADSTKEMNYLPDFSKVERKTFYGLKDLDEQIDENLHTLEEKIPENIVNYPNKLVFLQEFLNYLNIKRKLKEEAFYAVNPITEEKLALGVIFQEDTTKTPTFLNYKKKDFSPWTFLTIDPKIGKQNLMGTLAGGFIKTDVLYDKIATALPTELESDQSKATFIDLGMGYMIYTLGNFSVIQNRSTEKYSSVTLDQMNENQLRIKGGRGLRIG